MNNKKKPNEFLEKSDDSLPETNDLDGKDVVSYTECTGLIQTPPLTNFHSESYADLYKICKNAPLSETEKTKHSK